MKKIITDKNSIAGLFSMLVFSIFAICIVAVLIMGINVYKTLSERDQASYNQRTCAHYLTTKIRQAPDLSSVETLSLGDGDSLVFYEIIENDTYGTYIYCSGGWLREYYTSEGMPEDPDLGEKILPAENLSISMEENLLTMNLPGQPDLKVFIRKEAPDEK